MPLPHDPTRRRTILDAAQRLVCHYGVAKTTVQDIAREAGVGVGSVYLEFESKDRLLQTLSEGWHARILQAMQEAASLPRPWPARLKAVVDTRVEAFLSLESAGTHAQDLVHCPCPQVKLAHQAFQEEELRILEELVGAARNDGTFAVGDPAVAARALQRAYAAFAPPWLSRGSWESARPLLDALHAIVLLGLVRRG